MLLLNIPKPAFTIPFNFLLSFSLTACVATTPQNTNDICAIFQEKDDWYDSSKEVYEKWGIAIHVQMAFMHQESRFVADAQPPRKRLLGFIPWQRPSSAYGYPQALDGTWNWYLHQSENWGADRDDFADAADFIGWYFSISHKQLGLSKTDIINQYLAYHEGHSGFRRKSHLKKNWLLKTSHKVARQAKRYEQQLDTCKEDLESKSWFFW